MFVTFNMCRDAIVSLTNKFNHSIWEEISNGGQDSFSEHREALLSDIAALSTLLHQHESLCMLDNGKMSLPTAEAISEMLLNQVCVMGDIIDIDKIVNLRQNILNEIAHLRDTEGFECPAEYCHLFSDQ